MSGKRLTEERAEGIADSLRASTDVARHYLLSVARKRLKNRESLRDSLVIRDGRALEIFCGEKYRANALRRGDHKRAREVEQEFRLEKEAA